MKALKRIFSLLLCTALAAGIAAAPASAETKTLQKGKSGTFKVPVFQDYGKYDYMPDQFFVSLDNLENTGVKNVAEAAAEALEEMEPGWRVLQLDPKIGMTMKNDLDLGFFVNEDKFEYTKNLMESFFKELSNYGAQIDIMFDDDENWPNPYGLENEAIAAFRQTGEEIYDSIAKHGHEYEPYIKEKLLAIEKSPKYTSQLKPLLDEIGFVYGPNYDLEYLNIHAGAQEPRRQMFYDSNPPEGATESFDKFTLAVKELAEEKYIEAILEPALKYFPNIKHSNFGDSCCTGELLRYDAYGNRVAYTPKTWTIATHSNVVDYGQYGTRLETYPPKEWRIGTYLDTPFQGLLHKAQQSVDAVTATKDSKITYWITRKKVMYNNNYYEESLLHDALYDPDPFLFWTGVYDDLDTDMQTLGRVLAHIDEMIGFDDRETLMNSVDMAPTMHQRYVLTGMKVNGYHLWRITPDLYCPGVTVENFCIDKDKPTFQIGNQFVEFPEGSFIYEPENPVSSYGYWVVSPLGTKPKEWRDASIPMPGPSVDYKDDDVPKGYMYEPNGEMPDELDLAESKTKVVIDKKPEESTGGETEDKEPVVEVQTLKLNPMKGNGEKTELFIGELPADVKGHWAEHTLANMYMLGIMRGTDKGMEPDSSVLKSEFLAMLERILGAEAVAYEGDIPDVANNAWYADVIQTAVTGGWISLDSVSYNAGPELEITRGEMCRVLAKALTLSSNAESTGFGDEISIPQSLKGDVAAVSQMGIITGYEDGTFRAGDVLTRAETAAVFERLLGIIPTLFE